MNKYRALSLAAVLIFIGGFGGYQTAHAAGSGPGTATISDTTGIPAAEGPTSSVTAERGVSDVFTVVLTIDTADMKTASSSPAFEVPTGFTFADVAGGAPVPTSASEVDVDGEWFAVGSGGSCAVSMLTPSVAGGKVTLELTSDCLVGEKITFTYKGLNGTVTPAADFNVYTDRGTGISQIIVGTPTVTVTDTNPTVTLTSSVADPTTWATFSVTSTFSESVSDFDLTDIVVDGGTVSNFVTTTADRVYTFSVTPNADGLLTINVATSSAVDIYANPNDAATQFSVTTDGTAPSTPVISPDSDTYTSAQTITITSAGSDTIRYTVDGTNPTCSAGTLYSGTFSVSASASVKAVGCDTLLNVSSVATNAYTINISTSGGVGGGGGGSFILFNFSNSPAPVSTVTNLPLTFVANTLVKLASDGNPATQQDSAVYYYGRDGRRHAFPNDRVYLTWYSDFSQVQIISAAELSRMPLGQNVTYRPGVRMVKFATLNRVYAVDAGSLLRWVKTEGVATALYGTAWNQQIDDISDAFFSDYRFGTDINSIADFNPSLVTAATSSIQADMGF